MKRGFCQWRQGSGRPVVSGNMPFFPCAVLLLVFGFRSSLFPVWQGSVLLTSCTWSCWSAPDPDDGGVGGAEPVWVTAWSTRACLASPSLLRVIKLVQVVSFWIKKKKKKKQKGFFWWKGCNSAWEFLHLPEIRVTCGRINPRINQRSKSIQSKHPTIQKTNALMGLLWVVRMELCVPGAARVWNNGQPSSQSLQPKWMIHTQGNRRARTDTLQEGW